ncbi:MAG: ABC transporter permease [Anaerolineae bacterium]|nr:ABC transporter permease [Anaerolineae bacterium]
MRKLWAMIRNEFLREFSSPMTLVFFLILPLLFTAAVGAGLGGMMGGDEDTQPEEYRPLLYVVQNDTSGSLGEVFLAALDEVNLTLKHVDRLPEGEFGLEIPADFSEQVLAGDEVTVTLHILPNDNSSQAVEQYVLAACGRVGGAILVARSGVEQAQTRDVVTTPAEETTFFQGVLEETLDAAKDPPVVVEVHWPAGTLLEDNSRAMADNSQQASAGQLVTWVQITLLGAAEVLVDERLRGTLRRLLISPTARAMILGGKLVARLALGLLQMTILLVGGTLLFGVNWGKDPLAVALVSFTFALASVSLGMLLATLVRSRGQAGSAVVGLSMGLSALGGAWYPLEITPQLYRQIVQILPSTWAMRAYTDILARGATWREVIPAAGVLLGFATLFIVIGMLRFRRYE